MFTSPNPDFKSLVQEKFRVNQFSHFLGFTLDEIKEGYIKGHLPLKEEHLQQDNFAHGGIVLTLCDVVAGFAAYSLVKPGQHVVTAQINVSCLRPGIGDTLEAIGKVVKPGRNLYFCESEVWGVFNGERKLVATSTSTMAVMRPQNSKS